LSIYSNLVFRIIFESREQYRVIDENFKIYSATITGHMRFNSQDLPAVGDWVQGRLQVGDWVLIDAIGERSSVLARADSSGSRQILATNVDVLLIVTSANHDLNLNRLDRYIIMAQSGGVKPVIVINKIELSENPEQLVSEVAERFKYIDVHGVSFYENYNLEQISHYATEGRTLAFVGSSGVGKSSLTNYLIGGEAAVVGNIRESDGRGRHTTTHRELHITKSGAVVIDTPGLRSVGLSEDAGLEEAFADIMALAEKCKFRDCKHKTEPKCAIIAALDSGELESDRWQNFQKLQREIAFEKRKVDKSLASAQKKEWAKRSQSIRQVLKAKNMN
jgi:ribosome biogenesis GTPase